MGRAWGRRENPNRGEEEEFDYEEEIVLDFLDEVSHLCAYLL